MSTAMSLSSPQMMPRLGVIRSETVMPMYGTSNKRNGTFRIEESFPSAKSSGSSSSSETLSPDTVNEEPNNLPVPQNPPALAPPIPSAVGPLVRSKKRRAEAKEVEKSPGEKKPRKKRGPFDQLDRVETSITRGWGACLRCHNQRVRCNPNPDDPSNPEKPCQTCLEVDMSTKKAIHQLPCLRYRLQKIVTYRSGGLNITDRFTHNEMVNLYDYKDSNIRVITMEQGICLTPLSITVRSFNTSHGDDLARKGPGPSSCGKKGPVNWPLAPLCLNDVEKTALEFKKYLHDNAVDNLMYAVRDSDGFIYQTYTMIVEHYKSLPDEVATGKTGTILPNEEKKVLGDAIIFWFALRHMLGSSWISGGDTDALGLHPIHPPLGVLEGKISTPRMIIAQFDSIQHERILKNHAPRVLKSLQKLYYTNNLHTWFTIYSITFMLLHHVSLASADRKRWAEQRNEASTRYGAWGSPLTKHIEELQEGTTYLLAHWHYYKHSIDLLSFDWEHQQGESSMKYLTPMQTNWMKRSCDLLREKTHHLKNIQSIEDRWEDEVYFVSKMYDTTWTQEKTFSAT